MEIPGNIYPELIDKLRAPVPDELLSWRIQRSGERNGQPWALLAPYIDSRILMARLDLIFGSDGWQSRSVIGGYGAEVMAKSRRDGSEYEMLVQHGAVAVEIGIWNGEEWIWKGDGASDQGGDSPIKAAFTYGFRRAAVAWDICSVRDLYMIDTIWANFTENGRYRDRIKGQWHNWDAPRFYGPGGEFEKIKPVVGRKPENREYSKPDPLTPRQPGRLSDKDTPVLERTLGFGQKTINGKKASDCTWQEVIDHDTGYAEWALDKGYGQLSSAERETLWAAVTAALDARDE